VTLEEPRLRSSRELADRRRSRRRRVRNRALLALALLVAVGIGIALGQALHDNPEPGGRQISVRTFAPLTQTTSP
jgi:ferric-dicitrate binding protein FerR (iron transport regulator)